MSERTFNKPEIASQKRVIKLPPAIGDWTTYRPTKILVKKIKSGLYGFDRLSKEELNAVLRIHYRFIESLLAKLKVDLGMGIEFASCQIEQTNYLNFLRSQNSPIVQGKIILPNVHEGVQWFIDLGIAHSIINHALGSHDLEPLNRSLTETENAIFSTAVTEYLPDYSKAFENVFSSPEFKIIGSPDAIPDSSLSTSSTLVVFSAELFFNDLPSGRISFGYLSALLKNMLKVFKEKNQAKTLNFTRLPNAILNKIHIPVTVTLGNTELQASQLNHLEVGDVVSLDTLTNSAILASLGNLIKVKAQPGVKNKKKVFRLAGFNEEENITFPPVELVEEKKQTGEKTELPEEEPTLKEEDVEEGFIEAVSDDDLKEEEAEKDEDFAEDTFDEELSDEDRAFLEEEETTEEK